MTLQEKFKDLKEEVIKELEGRDLIDEVIYLQDPVNFPIKLFIIGQKESELTVEVDGDEIRTYDLSEIPLESLIELL